MIFAAVGTQAVKISMDQPVGVGMGDSHDVVKYAAESEFPIIYTKTPKIIVTSGRAYSRDGIGFYSFNLSDGENTVSTWPRRYNDLHKLYNRAIKVFNKNKNVLSKLYGHPPHFPTKSVFKSSVDIDLMRERSKQLPKVVQWIMRILGPSEFATAMRADESDRAMLELLLTGRLSDFKRLGEQTRPPSPGTNSSQGLRRQFSHSAPDFDYLRKARDQVTRGQAAQRLHDHVDSSKNSTEEEFRKYLDIAASPDDVPPYMSQSSASM